MLIGYARVSTRDQDLALQTAALKEAGCEKIFSDKMSGGREKRPGLLAALDLCRAGDTLVVWKLDRFGRSMQFVVNTILDLDKRGIGFRSLTEAIDLTSKTGKLLLSVFGWLGEVERDLAKERTSAALAARKAQGKVVGRKSSITPRKAEIARKLLQAGERPRDVAEAIGVSVATFYRHFPPADRQAANAEGN